MLSCLVVTCLESDDLLSLLCVMFFLCFCYFPMWCPGSGVILDICLLPYFDVVSRESPMREFFHIRIEGNLWTRIRSLHQDTNTNGKAKYLRNFKWDRES